ncbi:hypothetical protein [Streptomyces hainanensis]|uniref:hypothetical protein n=1 Tax=Streptomyces hainanensis TaxID=402648 RepID=UPI001404E1B1|nr:hypothetical protein [Streptomyces hainanensis]
MSETQRSLDEAAEARHVRFGALPERIRPEDRFEEVPAAAPDPARDLYNDDDWLVRACG